MLQQVLLGWLPVHNFLCLAWSREHVPHLQLQCVREALHSHFLWLIFRERSEPRGIGASFNLRYTKPPATSQFGGRESMMNWESADLEVALAVSPVAVQLWTSHRPLRVSFLKGLSFQDQHHLGQGLPASALQTSWLWVWGLVCTQESMGG